MENTTICQRLTSLGVPPAVASQLTQTISKWVKCSGEEWTVQRLKDLKNWYAQYLSGNVTYHVPWFKRDGNYPSGPFSIFWKRAKTKRQTARAFQCLNVYTSYVSPKVTSKQWKKFHDSAVNPPEDKSTFEDTLLFVVPYLDGDRKAQVGESKKAPDLLSYPWSDNRSVPSYPKSVPESSMLWLRQELNCDFFNHNYTNGSRLGEVLPLDKLSLATDMGTKLQGLIVRDLPPDVKSSVGNISFIQEPGYKLRVIANPRRFLQLALVPMQKQLLDLLRRVSTDYTYRQTEAVPVIQQWMSSGRKLFSVDLSDATNVFPLEKQLRVLRQIGCKPGDIDLFEKISRSPWYVPHLRRTIRFEKGQPLGLAPSFPSFALAHNVLLQNLSNKLKLKEDYFCVLGDDVCIGHEELNHQYREALDRLGCPVSQQKTLESYKVANFAGYTIFKDFAFPVGKWHSISDRNFMDVIRMMGMPACRLLRPRQRAVVERLLEVPEFFGGLGFNPKGKTLEQRIHDNMDVIESLVTNEAELLLEHQDHVFKTNLISFLGENQTVRSDVIDSFRARPGPRSLLTSINDFHRITKTVVEESKVEKPYVSRSRESDPRGSTLLSQYENKLPRRKGPSI